MRPPRDCGRIAASPPGLPGHIQATALGHPLLSHEECVANDMMLGGDTRLWVLSGSNMSGKSTFLRSLGLNIVLALAGAPVRAKTFSVPVLAIGATLRVQDSLMDGQSRFYAEIDRLRRIQDVTEQSRPVLYLFDELLSGTNSHERAQGATAFLKTLVGRQTLGIVTTHDLALTSLADHLPEAKNMYLAENWSEGKPQFSYTLHEGFQKEGNALRWMRSLGMDV